MAFRSRFKILSLFSSRKTNPLLRPPSVRISSFDSFVYIKKKNIFSNKMTFSLHFWKNQSPSLTILFDTSKGSNLVRFIMRKGGWKMGPTKASDLWRASRLYYLGLQPSRSVALTRKRMRTHQNALRGSHVRTSQRTPTLKIFWREINNLKEKNSCESLSISTTFFSAGERSFVRCPFAHLLSNHLRMIGINIK